MFSSPTHVWLAKSWLLHTTFHRLYVLYSCLTAKRHTNLREVKKRFKGSLGIGIFFRDASFLPSDKRCDDSVRLSFMFRQCGDEMQADLLHRSAFRAVWSSDRFINMLKMSHNCPPPASPRGTTLPSLLRVDEISPPTPTPQDRLIPPIPQEDFSIPSTKNMPGSVGTEEPG